MERIPEPEFAESPKRTRPILLADHSSRIWRRMTYVSL